jgi:hypothetical protein
VWRARVATNRQLEEVMTDFWLNHFNVFAGKGPPQPYYLVEYEREVIRPNALGKFRDLVGAVAKSPAMLFYLDNARSMADSTRPRLTPPGRGAFGDPDAVARIGGMAARGASATGPRSYESRPDPPRNGTRTARDGLRSSRSRCGSVSSSYAMVG